VEAAGGDGVEADAVRDLAVGPATVKRWCISPSRQRPVVIVPVAGSSARCLVICQQPSVVE
jgi:hypothetical protein